MLPHTTIYNLWSQVMLGNSYSKTANATCHPHKAIRHITCDWEMNTRQGKRIAADQDIRSLISARRSSFARYPQCKRMALATRQQKVAVFHKRDFG